MGADEDKRRVSSAVDLAVQRELICLLYGSPSVPLINGVVALVTAAVLWQISALDFTPLADDLPLYRLPAADSVVAL